MYPFESVRWAWDALWAALCERVGWLPDELAHSGDVHARWESSWDYEDASGGSSPGSMPGP